MGGYDSVYGKIRNSEWKMCRATHLLITLSDIGMLRYPATGGGITILDVPPALCARKRAERGKERRVREDKDR